MSNKEYPLELENWGDQQYLVISRGHHDLDEFKKAVNKEYSSWGNFFEVAYHTYYKATPKDGCRAWYTPCSKGIRGAFPATVAQEGWTQEATDQMNKEPSHG